MSLRDEVEVANLLLSSISILLIIIIRLITITRIEAENRQCDDHRKELHSRVESLENQRENGT